MALESLEKLRAIADKMDDAAASMSEHGFSPLGMKAAGIADAIEREVSERYVALPLDAVGVPWHIGDYVDKCGEVEEMVLTASGWRFEGIPAIEPACHIHGSSRTVEDVLRDVWEEAIDYAKSVKWRAPDEVFAERADELREIMEADYA